MLRKILKAFFPDKKTDEKEDLQPTVKVQIVARKEEREEKITAEKKEKMRASKIEALSFTEENRKAVRCYEDKKCPNCSHQFEKTVTRKRACPTCKVTLVVRTHYEAKQKMILLESQLEDYEKKASIYYTERHLERIMTNEGLAMTFNKEKAERLGYSSHDVAWGLLNQKGLEHAANMRWGLFRNTRLSMAEILNSEKKWKHGLVMLLEVCYYDLNGATNVGSSDPYMLKNYPPFRPKDFGFLAPGVLGMIERNMEMLEFNIEQVKELFIEHNQKVQNDLMPVSPEKAWGKMEKALKEFVKKSETS